MDLESGRIAICPVQGYFFVLEIVRRNEQYLLPLSHDEVVQGKATIVQKMNGEYENKFPQARALYMYMYAHPGKKLNFMGNEIGQLREWDEKRFGGNTHYNSKIYTAKKGKIKNEIGAFSAEVNYIDKQVYWNIIIIKRKSKFPQG